MITVEIKKITDYGKFRSKLRVARLQLPTAQKEILRKTVEDILLTKIKMKMAQANYSRDVIVSTIITDIFIFEETFQVIIKSEALSKDTKFDLARAKEFGTAPHDIWSTGDWPLKFESESGEKVYVSTKNKPVKHPGTKGLNIIKDTIREERENIQKEFQRREEQWFKSVIA